MFVRRGQRRGGESKVREPMKVKLPHKVSELERRAVARNAAASGREDEHAHLPRDTTQRRDS